MKERGEGEKREIKTSDTVTPTHTHSYHHSPGKRAEAALLAASRCFFSAGSLLPIACEDEREAATEAAFEAPTVTGFGAGGVYTGVGAPCGVGRSPPIAAAGMRVELTASEGALFGVAG